jgi:hypothetical protein
MILLPRCWDATPPGETPQAWLIADSRALRRYGLGHARPFPFTPEAWRRTGYLYAVRRRKRWQNMRHQSAAANGNDRPV